MQNRRLVWLGILWLALSVATLGYELLRQPKIIVQWATETEVNTAGFNLYRSSSIEGPFERLNSELVYGAGDPLTGAEYEFVDSEIGRNQTYFYQLEELETNGSANRIDLVQATSQGVQVGVIALAGLGLGVGVLLLFSGLRQRPEKTAFEGDLAHSKQPVVPGIDDLAVRPTQSRGDSLPVRDPDLVWRSMDDELVIVRPSDGQIRVLNGVGSFVWRSMDGERTISDLTELVCTEYEVSAGSAEVDISAFLAGLLDEGMVHWKSGDSPADLAGATDSRVVE